MSGVITEGDGRTVIGPNAAGGAEEQKLPAPQPGGVPAHAGVLGEPENVAAGPVQQDLFRDRQGTGRTRGTRTNVVERLGLPSADVVKCDFLAHIRGNPCHDHLLNLPLFWLLSFWSLAAIREHLAGDAGV